MAIIAQNQFPKAIKKRPIDAMNTEPPTAPIKPYKVTPPESPFSMGDRFKICLGVPPNRIPHSVDQVSDVADATEPKNPIIAQSMLPPKTPKSNARRGTPPFAIT